MGKMLEVLTLKLEKRQNPLYSNAVECSIVSPASTI